MKALVLKVVESWLVRLSERCFVQQVESIKKRSKPKLQIKEFDSKCPVAFELRREARLILKLTSPK